MSVKNYFNKCRYCEKQPWSDKCPTYRTVKERKQQLKDSCFNCLKTGHLAKECKRSKICVHCGEGNAHHRSLCPKKFKEVISAKIPQEVNVLTEQNTVREENALISSGGFVLMQTPKTELKNKTKKKKKQKKKNKKKKNWKCQLWDSTTAARFRFTKNVHYRKTGGETEIEENWWTRSDIHVRNRISEGNQNIIYWSKY